MRRNTPGSDTWLITAVAGLLFMTSITVFRARPTDISALRVLAGDVPYRDFWTMYAPGSFVTLAGAFAVFGRALVVSNLMGILTATAGVAVFHRLVAPEVGRSVAAWLAGLVTMAYFGTGYHVGFTSFPPAILLVLIAALIARNHCSDEGVAWAVVPGVLLGLAALYKHDIAGYAAIAACVTTLLVRWQDGNPGRFTASFVMGGTAASVPLAAAAVLVMLGAGPDVWNDLIRFPVVDFPHVRGEYFPIIPQLRDSLTGNVREARQWAICNLPTIGVFFGVATLGRRWGTLEPSTRFLAAFATVAFGFSWMAAHVQLNTNAISLALWGTAVGGIGLRHMDAPAATRLRASAAPVILAWGGLFIAQNVYTSVVNRAPMTWLDLPHLHGIRVPANEAPEWRALSAAIANAAPPEAPLLFVANRNDVVIHLESFPFWLSPRRSATRHHELHPGITDTEAVQRKMLADAESGPAPVVVHEYRFNDATLDRMLVTFQEYVPVGASLLDGWIRERYERDSQFLAYTVYRRRSD